MHSLLRILAGMSKTSRVVTRGLMRPFEDNIDNNRVIQAQVLVIAENCKSIGMNPDQTKRTLGPDGYEFAQWLASQKITLTTEVISAFGALVPVAGEVGEGSVIVLNEYGQEVLG